MHVMRLALSMTLAAIVFVGVAACSPGEATSATTPPANGRAGGAGGGGAAPGPVTIASAGEDVKQGQLLFSLDRRPLEAALQQAQANLERDQAQAANAAVQAKRFQDL